jgi:hypothetical protein
MRYILLVIAAIIISACVKHPTQPTINVLFTDEKTGDITTYCGYSYNISTRDKKNIYLKTHIGAKAVKRYGDYFLQSTLAMKMVHVPSRELGLPAEVLKIETAWFENQEYSTKTWFSEFSNDTFYSSVENISIIPSLLELPATFFIIRRGKSKPYTFAFPRLISEPKIIEEKQKFEKCLNGLEELVDEKNNRG